MPEVRTVSVKRIGGGDTSSDAWKWALKLIMDEANTRRPDRRASK